MAIDLANMFFASPNKKEDQKEFTVRGTYNNIYLLFCPGICYFFSLCHKIVQRDLASLNSHRTSFIHYINDTIMLIEQDEQETATTPQALVLVQTRAPDCRR